MVYIENKLCITTLNFYNKDMHRAMKQIKYTFQNCDLTFPHCNTVFVILFISIHRYNYT